MADLPPPDYLLADQEVRALTGAAHRRKQLAWLAERGIRAEIGADGRVKVLREAVDRYMLPAQARRTSARTGPNLDALRKAS